jgi:Resolvase, N terminal domain
VAPLLIGYARVSTDEQDRTAQREALATLGISAERIYVAHGLTGINRDRPGLREALAACREGDTLVVTKLDRLARSLPDARDIVDELTHRHVKLSLGGSRHDPNDPRRPAAVQRARHGRRVRGRPDPDAHPRGHVRRQRQRPPTRQAAQAQPPPGGPLVALHRAGEYSSAELGDIFGVARSTVYRAIQRDQLHPQTLSSKDLDGRTTL